VSPAQPANYALPELPEKPVENARVEHEAGLVERRTKNGFMSDFAAVSAADAAVVDIRHGLRFQGIRIRFDRQGGAAAQAYAGMVTGAGIRIDPKTIAQDPSSLLYRLRKQG